MVTYGRIEQVHDSHNDVGRRQHHALGFDGEKFAPIDELQHSRHDRKTVDKVKKFQVLPNELQEKGHGIQSKVAQSVF